MSNHNRNLKYAEEELFRASRSAVPQCETSSWLLLMFLGIKAFVLQFLFSIVFEEVKNISQTSFKVVGFFIMMLPKQLSAYWILCNSSASFHAASPTIMDSVVWHGVRSLEQREGPKHLLNLSCRELSPVLSGDSLAQFQWRSVGGRAWAASAQSQHQKPHRHHLPSIMLAVKEAKPSCIL